jgi:hypothetical protein
MNETISIGFHGPESLEPIIEAVEFLKTHNDYLILATKPTGTRGSALALREALRQMGKRASDRMCRYITSGMTSSRAASADLFWT